VALRSWVESANDPATDFPIENLPFGVFRRAAEEDDAHIGLAIGDSIVDLARCYEAGLLEANDEATQAACTAPFLNELMVLGGDASRAVRHTIAAMLMEGSMMRSELEPHLVKMRDAGMLLPCAIGDYTDFYAGIHHASNVGSMFRPDNPLLPNYKWIPIGYHGRVSSIVMSGRPFHRPNGQTRPDPERPPQFGPSQRLDYEMELGAFIGPGNALGDAIPAARAEEHVFGLCLVNDWSARDIQTWEYQPLGPFLAKNFATSISPWIVTLDALDPFRVAPFERPEGDPRPLPYLASNGRSGFDITLEVWLRTARMTAPVLLSRGNSRDLYWTIGQLVTHHASNGCSLRPGDLLASGTISGTTKESRGSMLELSWGGKEPVALPNGEERRFLEDGDEVIFRAYCEATGHRRIGFGECRGVVLPAK
jgi:fumarylacetoacetase